MHKNNIVVTLTILTLYYTPPRFILLQDILCSIIITRLRKANPRSSLQTTDYLGFMMIRDSYIRRLQQRIRK